ncbi:MAG: chromosome partitioning protein ParB [Gammaproteobacteria bacterium 39-13]|nr:ParB/RepB/Spo0J family partition protein [Gammaproteobacteria bacterium]OJV90703.1 MAG: chromosome partitioning protein ParB [Gammaproteobacteria bacterium 39-13]
MSTKKRGLGKGLNELLSASLGGALVASKESKPQPVIPPQEKAVVDSELQYLPVEKLVRGPFQPRQQIRHEGIEQLAESIRAQGLLQPIVVRAKDQHYEIIAGERRWRAAQLAGLNKVPTLVRQVPDEAAMAMALIENIQRENLNAIEEALALKRLAEELQLTHLQVAEAIGKSRASVTNLLRLLTLNPDVQLLLEQDQIEMGHARALLALKGQEQSEMAQKVVAQGLSVRETERLVSKLQDPEPTTSVVVSNKRVMDPNIRRLEEDLADKLGARVAIRHGNRGKGLVVIRYNDVDELEGILAHIK